MARAEDPDKWSEDLSKPLPGRFARKNKIAEERLRQQELEQLRGLIPENV